MDLQFGGIVEREGDSTDRRRRSNHRHPFRLEASGLLSEAQRSDELRRIGISDASLMGGRNKWTTVWSLEVLSQKNQSGTSWRTSSNGWPARAPVADQTNAPFPFPTTATEWCPIRTRCSANRPSARSHGPM